METYVINLKLKVTALGPLAADERSELVGTLAKHLTPIPMLPWGITTELQAIEFSE
jgi:hypothetical protein